MSLNWITRREALYVLGAAAIPAAAAEAGLLHGTRVDHVENRVQDEKSQQSRNDNKDYPVRGFHFWSCSSERWVQASFC